MSWMNWITSIVCGMLGLFLLTPFMGYWPAVGVYLLIGAWSFMNDAFPVENKS